jgi:hypothetical protein
MRFAPVLLAACIPSFEEVECYSSLDCPADQDCVADRCRPVGRDAGPDAGPPDARDDAAFPDAAETDAAEADAGLGDAGLEDSALPDAAPDAGFSVQASPPRLDFGERPVSCPGPDGVAMVTNLGVSVVTITAVSLAGGTSAAYGLQPIATPFTLGAGVSQTIAVAFAPSTIGAHNGRVLISYIPEPFPLTVDLVGRAVSGSTVTDAFVASAGAIDVLFVVDDNDGMAQIQQGLSNQIGALFTILEDDAWDYQIGVTTGDLSPSAAQGALLGSPAFVTRATTPDPIAEVRNRLTVGEAAFPADEGLEASRLALSPPLTSGANAGFLRASAALLVVYVANRPDASPMTVSAYSTFLEGIETDPMRVHANAVVPAMTSCVLGDGTTATYAGRQIGMAQNTGGVVSDVCGSDFTAALSTLPVAPRQTVFGLRLVPRSAQTIVVRVGGLQVPSANGANWSYDAGTNAVVFAPGAAPDHGQAVDITYAAGC